jgi:hypothetical protein
MSENIAPKYYNLKELFSSDSYAIPIYQRNYAWREAEITQLIQDIVDYAKKNSNSNYYIGTLIVWERKNEGKISYETIDGQQRLTTLSILLSLIKNEYSHVDLSWYKELNLKFDSRKNSTKTLQLLFEGSDVDTKECNIEIKQGYENAKKALNRILKEEIDFLSIESFCSYLFEKVQILRVLVPEDTDLNHYFEIMNSRGEQLEKHEILKAKCLEVLDESDRYAFNLIWEACSNMEKYVQYGFSPEQRNVIWGADNNSLVGKDEVYDKLKPANQENKQDIKISIANLLNLNTQYSETLAQDDDNFDRFNTIINFSNFLLHILRIQRKQDIPLDDKRLIELFEPFLKNENTNKEFVKQFGYNLLRGKFLFDKYIIKREFAKGTDHWSLKQLKCYERNRISYVNTFGEEDSNDDINREILMLLSMFHVSSPTLVYKHWLNAALKYVFENENINANNYKKYLENLAKAFLNDRFLATNPKDYFDIIYTNNGLPQQTEINVSKLNQGTAIENFIFNYLDYLLWQDYRNEKKYFEVENRIINDNTIEQFEYTFRSSVEHYYPRHPIEGNPKIEDQWLNHFGNLCLISSSKNSRLSNYMPKAKKDHYKGLTIDSIKQRIMMEYEQWDTKEIAEHGNKMTIVIEDGKNAFIIKK